MLKKTMTYEDFDGNKRTEDFYFNLTKAECAELEFGVDGGLSTMLQKIISERSTPRIIEIIKQIILKAYGVKSSDGKRFIKNQQIREEFSQTNAYSDLFMELAFDETACAKFMEAIVPFTADEEAKAQAREQVAALLESNGIDTSSDNVVPLN